jgi:hypothetical protein
MLPISSELNTGRQHSRPQQTVRCREARVRDAPVLPYSPIPPPAGAARQRSPSIGQYGGIEYGALPVKYSILRNALRYNMITYPTLHLFAHLLYSARRQMFSTRHPTTTPAVSHSDVQLDIEWTFHLRIGHGI